MAEFTVGYERKLSDGNYGSEGLSMSWTWTNDDAASASSLELAAAFLRKTVLAQLARSAAARVAFEARRELDPRPLATPAAPSDSERTWAPGASTVDPQRHAASEDMEDLPF